MDALSLPGGWRDRLKRNFWRAGYVETLLRRLGEGLGGAIMPDAARRRFLSLTRGKTASVPRCGPPPTTRSPACYIERARGSRRHQTQSRHCRSDHKIVRHLRPGGRRDARRTLAFLTAANIKLDGPLAVLDARLKTIASLGLDLSRVRFTAHFGRNLEYYTGFVFELWSQDAEGPVQVAGGGRYDTLMQSLGAKKPVSAIGCALRTERLLAARKFAGAA